jgi:hypothetical protein
VSTQLRLGKKLGKLVDTPTVLGTAVGAVLHGRRQEDLLELIVAYSNSSRTDDLSGLAEFLLRALGEIHIQGEPTVQQSKAIQKASEELQKDHVKFKAALTWLCSPKNSEPAASPSLKQLKSGQVEWGRYPLIDKASEDFIGYFENHGLIHFRSRLSLQEGRLLLVPRVVHLIDVFCACVLDHCLGRRPSEMAIKICPRCGKFFSSQRREFCSKDCQWKHYWTRERRSDDKWVKDLEKFSEKCRPQYGRSVEDLRKKLALPKVIRRLKSLKAKIGKEDWTGWRQIARRIAAIEKLAAKPRSATQTLRMTVK